VRDSAALAPSHRLPSRLRRVLAGALASMLAAGGLVAVSVAAPIVQAPAANAAPNFVCSAPNLYMTSAAGRDIYRLDANTGVTSVAYTTGLTGGTLNQLAVTRDGTQVLWTDGASALSGIYEYTPGGVGVDPVLQRTDRGPAAAAGNTMGGLDLSNGRYVFGGSVGANDSIVLHSYDPATNTPTGNVATVALPGATGANGDLAFSPAGTLYLVAGGATTAQLYRVTGGIPTATGPAALTATRLGGPITAGGVNSIAFGADGFLYLYAAGQLVQVNPSNGSVVEPRISLSGSVAAATDFASCASPSTVRGDVVLTEPRQDPSDQLQVVIGGGSLSPTDPSTTGTTTGTGTSVGSNPVTGPVIVLPGDTITVDQRPAPGSATPPSEYAQEWVCRDTAYGNAIVSSGFGSQASFTVPQNPASAPTCSAPSATRRPRPARPSTRRGWTRGRSAPSARPSPTRSP
jgi:hypothetical protein